MTNIRYGQGVPGGRVGIQGIPWGNRIGFLSQKQKSLEREYDDHHVISRGARGGLLYDDDDNDVYSNP